MTELYSHLCSAVDGKSALRLVVSLSPANADGLVFPPTYADNQSKACHIFRPAWVDGQKRGSVLLDSVQSQANRIELAILDAHKRGKISYPEIELTVNTDNGVEIYSVLQLSHRVYDAALRMTSLNGEPFEKSSLCQQIYAARTEKATALYQHAPITLALGGWDSHGRGGPLSAKLPRLISSQIIGLDAEATSKGSVKFDPMDIRKGDLFKSSDPNRLYEIDKAKSSDGKKIKPSEAGLGNVPNLSEKGAGAVISEAIQTSIVSCSAVRRLRFETAEGKLDDARDRAGQAVIVALGLFGLLYQMDNGYYLRSGCDLIPKKAPQLEVIGRTLVDRELVPIDSTSALEALNQSLEAAKEFGLTWRKEKIVVQADDVLTTLINNSRKATKGAE